MTRSKRRDASTAVQQVSKTLLDMPTEVLATICAFCDVPTKMRIEETCKRLRALLAQPADHSALWGVITVRVEPRASPLVDTTQIVAWLARRAAGIRAIVVRPPAGATKSINSALHMTLFAVAGGCQGTHVALELRSGRNCLDTDEFMPFDQTFWAAPSSPNVQPGLTALAATLTRLEIKYSIYVPRQTVMHHLCSLARLEEATLWLEVASRNTEQDGVWEAAGRLPKLRRLAIGGDEWCTEAILRETGPQLTSLSLEIMGTGTAGTGIAASWLTKLSGLRELTVKEFAGSIIDTINLSSMTGLTALELNFESCYSPNVAVTIHSDFTFLASAHSLRVLTLEGLNGVNDQLLAAVLRISTMERLHVKGLQEWKWSAATIGRLIARAAAERPGLHIEVDEPLDYDEY